MAPEQMTRPDRVDARADNYEFGVMLYEMLTGNLPTEADSSPPRPPLATSGLMPFYLAQRPARPGSAAPWGAAIASGFALAYITVADLIRWKVESR